MDAIRVCNRAGRRLGMVLIIMALALMPCLAGEVIYTVTGTVAVGVDDRNYFGLGKKIPEGTPFTAVATFDDTKTRVVRNDVCPESESTVRGGALSDVRPDGTRDPSAGTATVTINGRPIEFGKRATAGSQISRYFHCWCNNMPSKISILVMDGRWMGMGPSPYASFTITVEVPDTPKGTTWTTPGTFTKTSGTLSMNSFSSNDVSASLNVKSIVVTRK